MKPSTLLRLYPRAWRERYGDEFAALLDQRRLTLADRVDIVRLGLHERLFHTWIGVPLIAVAIAQGSYALGQQLKAWWPAPDWSVALAGVLIVVWIATLLYRGVLEARRLWHRRHVGPDQIWNEVTIRALLCLAMVVGTLNAWHGVPPTTFYWQPGLVRREIFIPFSWLMGPAFTIALLSQSWSARAVAWQWDTAIHMERWKQRERLRAPRRPLGLS